MHELPERIRAFVAIRVSPEVERAIEEIVMRLRSDKDGIKWVAGANLHVTLKFLGPAVPLTKVDRLQDELAVIASGTAAFELEAGGIGGFPDLNHPHVLWVGLRGTPLIDLARRADEAAARCGFEREQRAFNSHLTIGRLKRPRLHPGTRSRIETLQDHDFGRSTIREMTLYRSITLPAGPIYEALRVFKFGS